MTRHYANVRVIVVTLLVIITILSVITLYSVFAAYSATKTLKASSRRSECRTKIVNAAEDEFRRDVTQLLDAALKHDSTNERAQVDHMLAYQDVNEMIAAICPKPISK